MWGVTYRCLSSDPSFVQPKPVSLSGKALASLLNLASQGTLAFCAGGKVAARVRQLETWYDWDCLQHGELLCLGSPVLAADFAHSKMTGLTCKLNCTQTHPFLNSVHCDDLPKKIG
eukprot:1156720-Pelagomonas_calceolata.AAC.6